MKVKAAIVAAYIAIAIVFFSISLFSLVECNFANMSTFCISVLYLGIAIIMLIKRNA